MRSAGTRVGMASATAALSAVAVKFVLELAALAATGYWAHTVTAPSGFGWLAALLAPALVAALWAVLIAPRSRRRLRLRWRVPAELAVFAAACLALWSTLGALPALIMGVVVTADAAVLLLTGSYAEAS
ncbi:DUF2568 domain-containing protein [Naasia sp. SYSU D00948]|uniref:DUF2568 domain-containing protein n=1 Tax=Naasia sp. SYSU D00948 TaxID=2817379 RepID=UPI001FED6A09|nr:DUF2568 domain-containing protein [Naasia sp. SYSU D00948]